jgi:hypothetical protein
LRLFSYPRITRQYLHRRVYCLHDLLFRGPGVWCSSAVDRLVTQLAWLQASTFSISPGRSAPESYKRKPTASNESLAPRRHFASYHLQSDIELALGSCVKQFELSELPTSSAIAIVTEAYTRAPCRLLFAKRDLIVLNTNHQPQLLLLLLHQPLC